jgi:hypothetical protein
MWRLLVVELLLELLIVCARLFCLLYLRSVTLLSISLARQTARTLMLVHLHLIRSGVRLGILPELLHLMGVSQVIALSYYLLLLLGGSLVVVRVRSVQRRLLLLVVRGGRVLVLQALLLWRRVRIARVVRLLFLVSHLGFSNSVRILLSRVLHTLTLLEQRRLLYLLLSLVLRALRDWQPLSRVLGRSWVLISEGH